VPELRPNRRGRLLRPSAGQLARRGDAPDGLPGVLSEDSKTAVIVPLAILDAIRQQPDHEPHWLALAAYLHDNGEYDLATVIRGYRLSVRDCLRDGNSVEQAVERYRAIGPRLLARIARRAREAEERAITDQGPPQ
jgi:hypothetical protein